MSNWAKKLQSIDYLGHHDWCDALVQRQCLLCDCGNDEVLQLISNVAIHIETVEELLIAILKDLECIDVHPNAKFVFDACIQDLKELLYDDVKPLYKNK